MGLLGADAEVLADDGEAFVFRQPGAVSPAVGELVLLIARRQVFALVFLRLNAADVGLGGLVLEQQHHEAADRLEVLEAFGAGELVAGARGQQPPLAGVQQHLVAVLAADGGHQLAGAHQHAGEPVNGLLVDVVAGVGGQLEAVEVDDFEDAFEGPAGVGAGVEQAVGLRGRRSGVSHAEFSLVG